MTQASGCVITMQPLPTTQRSCPLFGEGGTGAQQTGCAGGGGITGADG